MMHYCYCILRQRCKYGMKTSIAVAICYYCVMLVRLIFIFFYVLDMCHYCHQQKISLLFFNSSYSYMSILMTNIISNTLEHALMQTSYTLLREPLGLVVRLLASHLSGLRSAYCRGLGSDTQTRHKFVRHSMAATYDESENLDCSL